MKPFLPALKDPQSSIATGDHCLSCFIEASVWAVDHKCESRLRWMYKGCTKDVRGTA